ncbi:MAG: Flp pilus assembly protein CpaB [Candidatus Omnitrophota bacterium]
MNRKIGVIVAVVLGGFAVILTNVYFQQKEKKLHFEEAAVLVAAKEISKGELIEYEMVTFKSMPVPFIQPGALTAKEMAVGKTALGTIMAGEQILATKLTTPGAGLTLAGKTPPGKRAMTISLENVSAVGGMVYPGDHVDVLGIFANPPVTLTLFQDVLILAVGQDMLPTGEGARRKELPVASPRTKDSMTLALSPQETQIISVAIANGKISLTLRPRMEVGKALPPIDLSNLPAVITFQTLLQLYMRTPTEEVQPQVEIIRGLKKEIAPISVKK